MFKEVEKLKKVLTNPRNNSKHVESIKNFYNIFKERNIRIFDNADVFSEYLDNMVEEHIRNISSKR